MKPSPTTALIALLACAAGSLTTWYTPSLIPGLLLGVVVYAGAVLLGANLFRLDRDQALIGTTRCILTALALTFTAVLRACITGINALARWDTIQLTRTGATQP